MVKNEIYDFNLINNPSNHWNALFTLLNNNFMSIFRKPVVYSKKGKEKRNVVFFEVWVYRLLIAKLVVGNKNESKLNNKDYFCKKFKN